MKTTIDIPESLYTTLAAASSAEGLTLEDYILRVAKEKIVGIKTTLPKVELTSKKHQLDEYWARLDSLPEDERRALSEAVAEVQAIIDEEFPMLDPKDWE